MVAVGRRQGTRRLLITATAQDGTTSGPIPVNGFASARYFGFYTDGSVALKSIEVDSQTSFAVGEFGIGTTPATTPVSYVALGDSYSSGEGAPPFFAGTDGFRLVLPCRRRDITLSAVRHCPDHNSFEDRH
jgi:hypothetical protein